MSAPLPVVEPEVHGQTLTARQPVWCTVVHDDPINTMAYVTWVFHSYFGMSMPVAKTRMLEVHTRGRAVVSRGARERMEMDVTAMHGFGLRATIEALPTDAPGADGEQGGPGAGGR